MLQKARKKKTSKRSKLDSECNFTAQVSIAQVSSAMGMPLAGALAWRGKRVH